MNQAVQSTQRQVPEVIQKLRQPAVIEEFSKVLPAGTDVQRLVSVAMLYILNSKNSQNILACDPISILSCIKKAFACGLELDGRNCHLVPYGRTCEFQMDYKGIIKLARECDLSVVCAETVCENDEFDIWTDETGRHFKHKPNVKKPRGETLGYYSFCKYQATGEPDFEFMTKDQIEAVRKRSKAGNGGPWVTDFDEMAKKTVIRRHSKRWDISPKLNSAIAAEDEGVIDVPSDVPDTGVAAMLNAPATTAATTTRRPRATKAVEAPPVAADPAPISVVGTPVDPDDSNPDLGPQTQAEAVRENVAPPSPPPVAQPSGPVSAPATAPSTASAPPRTGAARQSQPDRIRGMLEFAGLTEDQLMDYLRDLGVAPTSCANLDQLGNLPGSKLNAVIASFDTAVKAIQGTQPA